MDFDSIDFNFSERLARDNNWNVEYSLRVIEEYKKFIYLCCISNQPITPSDAVDQAWHLHLTYTKSYWKDFCESTLEKEIHHSPTKGGESEREKFSDCYNLTFERYENEFGQKPPSDIWLDKTKRFKDVNFRRINVNNYWLVKKPSKALGTSLKFFGIIILIPYLFMNAKDNDAPIPVIIFIIIVFILIFMKGKRGGGSGCSYDCSYDSSCGSDGCSGCGGCSD
ncbi:hypothetical protein [Mangrovimonas sp. TPBH4]|uniref:glycine-rich domain-containing protein n=1 Tax=Mangrovimonas sp. TPBH4 TaxID=1645914 RepID=UPI0018D06515|nr:hypothetical protein [Mangrovimonas sp. TPBH4]